MKSSLECAPCLLRQALDAARHSIPDEKKREEEVRRLMRELSRMDFSQPPPVAARRIHRLLRRSTGVEDPYREAKERFNTMALALLPSFEEKITRAADPFAAAVRLAIAGNVIDLGVKGNLTGEEAFAEVERAFGEPVAGNISAFRDAVMSAESILYLADNAGEIVFDTALVRALPAGRVTVAVRGKPVINDATMEDAVAAGITSIAHVMDNGSDAPGTLLGDCSPQFLKIYHEVDLVIAKGQGNFETLCDEDRNIYFLFKVKCPPVAAHTGLAVGTRVIAGPAGRKRHEV